MGLDQFQTLQRAEEVSTVKPKVAYYLRLHALETVLATAQPEGHEARHLDITSSKMLYLGCCFCIGHQNPQHVIGPQAARWTCDGSA